MELDKKKILDMKECEHQIEASGAVPIVKGEAFTNASRYEVTPYKVRLFFGDNEAVKEFDIKDVIFSGWPANITLEVPSQAG